MTRCLSRTTAAGCGRSPTGSSAHAPTPTTPFRRPGCASAGRTRATIENLGAWLSTVVSRVCLNMLQARKTRPQPVPTLPEAAADDDPEYEALLADSVGLALLVVLDDADAGRARRVRPARHLRDPVRRHRPDRRPQHARHAPAREPRPRARAAPGCERRGRPAAPGRARRRLPGRRPRRQLRGAARASAPRRRAARRRRGRQARRARRDARPGCGRRVLTARPRRHPRAARRRPGARCGWSTSSRRSSTGSRRRRTRSSRST